jgi:phage terminase large subunit-like protein|tara:strand:+ start:7143 stop:8618 length:1476 start_codon:yes stop_codon:yes gene_type:complete
MNRKKLEDNLKKKQQLIEYAKNYPLSVSLLWVPHCHNWKGITGERDRGCGRPMKRIKGDLYRCDHCDITEKRTSQQHSLLSLGSESTLISGGNRAGKTEVGACLSVAFASGSKEQYVRDWLQLNNLPLDLVPENPSTVWCASLSYKDGLEYLRPKLDKYLPIGTKKTRWTSQDRAVAILPNGGRIVSMSCDSGREGFQGGSVSMVWIDEEPNDEGIFHECLLRTVDQKGKVIITATPLKGLSWMFERFVENPAKGFEVVKISGLDNPYVSSFKMRRTVSHLTEASQRSRLFGEFSSQSGLVYPEFSKDTHLIDIEEIPNHWRRYISIDFGSSHPFCALWVAEAPAGYYSSDTTLIVYRELYWTNKTTIESGREINRINKLHNEEIHWYVADPESKDGRLTLGRECNIRTLPAPKHLGVNEGINMVREYLQIDKEGKSRLLFTKDVKNTLREFRLYKWDNKSKKDVVKKTNDHAMDSLRYGIMQYRRMLAHK